MTADDLNRVAEFHVEAINPGMWLEMSDTQKDAALRNIKQVLMAFLMCRFSIRKAAIRIPV